MTSEIAVLNQRCVALAADSAVTLTDGRKVVVRNERRKLFELGSGVPVGVMFFGDADIMGHPWDMLIEHFGTKGKYGSRPHVRDYAATFVSQLDHNEEFFPRDRHRDEYKRLLASVFRYLMQLAQFLQQNTAKERKPPSRDETLRQVIDLVWHHYQFKDDGTPRHDLPCFPPGFGAVAAHENAATVEDLITRGFTGYALDADARQKLRDIAVFCVTKDVFLEDVTGLVFAGYGTAERYPSIVTYNVSAVVNGIVKRSEVDAETIDNDMRSGITLYAECDAAYAFLRGIEQELEIRIFGTLEAMNEELVDQVLASIPNLDTAQRDAIKRQFRDRQLPQYLNRFFTRLAEFQRQAYVDPVLQVLEIATRQDMAETARELVALNIFKKRIMAKQPTAGGDIDVAVISREDGFQWWKKQKG